MEAPTVETVDTDLLILGGGMAGCGWSVAGAGVCAWVSRMFVRCARAAVSGGWGAAGVCVEPAVGGGWGAVRWPPATAAASPPMFSAGDVKLNGMTHLWVATISM